MVNTIILRTLKCLVPVIIIVFAQKIYEAKESGVLEALWIRTYDGIAETNEWLDSFLPESIYSDESLWTPQSEEEGSQRPVQFKPIVENGTQFNSEAATYFTASMRPRRWRTSNILFRVGELIYHHSLNLYCVIVGWDKTAKAPPEWLDKVYTDSKTVKAKQVHYMSICASESRIEDNIFTYLSQDEISRIEKIPEQLSMKLTYLQAHFNIKTEEDFERMRTPYPPRPWLRKLYPAD